MELYAKYLLEREGFELIHNDSGWLSYQCQGDECYIRDIYVVRDKRGIGLASQMTNEAAIIARERGCKYLTGSCVPSTKGATTSMLSMLSYGFQIHSAHQDLIVLRKML